MFRDTSSFSFGLIINVHYRIDLVRFSNQLWMLYEHGNNFTSLLAKLLSEVTCLVCSYVVSCPFHVVSYISMQCAPKKIWLT